MGAAAIPIPSQPPLSFSLSRSRVADTEGHTLHDVLAKKNRLHLHCRMVLQHIFRYEAAPVSAPAFDEVADSGGSLPPGGRMGESEP